jgi:hypothetical protein
MGVEYTHGIFVADLSWRPKLEHVAAVHAVLKAWKLASAKLGYWNLETDEKLAKPKALPPNALIKFGNVEGKPVEAALGASMYDLDAEGRYCEVALILGVDYRVISAESYEVRVRTPPKNGAKPVERSYVTGVSGATYVAKWTTTPPKTKAPGAFPGVWRSGVILDCGKDVPQGCEDEGFAATAKLHTDLEKALGTKLVEQGWIY